MVHSAIMSSSSSLEGGEPSMGSNQHPFPLVLQDDTSPHEQDLRDHHEIANVMELTAAAAADTPNPSLVSFSSSAMISSSALPQSASLQPEQELVPNKQQQQVEYPVKQKDHGELNGIDDDEGRQDKTKGNENDAVERTTRAESASTKEAEANTQTRTQETATDDKNNNKGNSHNSVGQNPENESSRLIDVNPEEHNELQLSDFLDAIPQVSPPETPLVVVTTSLEGNEGTLSPITTTATAANPADPDPEDEEDVFFQADETEVDATETERVEDDNHEDICRLDVDSDGHAAAMNFAMEHRILLRAALGLLTERDERATRVGMMDLTVYKSGSLKKASHLMNGVWRSKFVEIRRGMFSYYENTSPNPQQQQHQQDHPLDDVPVSLDASGNSNNSGQGVLRRKDIPLDASCTKCRAVKLHQNALNFTPGGALFEISVGNTRRLWMTHTREERQRWMQAIHSAMVGGSVTRGDDALLNHHGWVRTVNTRSPFKNDLRLFLKVQSTLRSAKTMTEYVAGLRELYSLRASMRVPVKWFMATPSAEGNGLLGATHDHHHHNNNHHHNNSHNNHHGADGETDAFREEAMDLSLSQLWRDLQRDSVSINGQVFRGDESHGPERIVGELTRCILAVGRKSSPPLSSSSVAGGTASGPTPTYFSRLSESQALAYARDILLASKRTRSAGDSFHCINRLCQNPDLVVIVPRAVEAEPVSLEVEPEDSELAMQSGFNNKSGWIKTRGRLQRTWKKLFFVLSSGTLSFYEGALPRPHGLRGQLVIKDATMSVKKVHLKETEKKKESDAFVLSLSSKDGVTLLLFETGDRLLDWIYAFECVPKHQSRGEVRRAVIRRPSQEFTPSSMMELIRQAEQSTREYGKKLGIPTEAVDARLSTYRRRTVSAVRVTIRASSEFNICTLDPQGIDELDRWGSVLARFKQAFRVTGGPQGRIFRGEEVVRVTVTDCTTTSPGGSGGEDGGEDHHHHHREHTRLEPPISPGLRRARMRRLFRSKSLSLVVEDSSTLEVKNRPPERDDLAVAEARTLSAGI